VSGLSVLSEKDNLRAKLKAQGELLKLNITIMSKMLNNEYYS